MAKKSKKPAKEKSCKDTLGGYYRYPKRCTTSFDCPLCQETQLAVHFEKHCKGFHNLDPRVECVWCFGKMTWDKNQKNKHVNHLILCWKKFKMTYITPIKIPEIPISEAPTTFTKFNGTNRCNAFDLFGLSRIPSLHPNAYRNFLLTPKTPIALTYQDENINLAVSYIQKFLQNDPNYNFYHVMVRAAAMNNFLECLGQTGDVEDEYARPEDLEPVTFLPFSCWCDGGDIASDYFRQHRHWIAVTRKETFKANVWKQFNISPLDRESRGPHYKCKKHKVIEVVMHLVNTMGYLSQRESRCNFTFRKGDEGEDDYEGIPRDSHQNHFLILNPILKDYRFILVLQWEGGLLELLHQNYKNLDPAKFIHLPLDFTDGKWHIKIKYLPNVPLNLVLPVSKKFRPTENPSDYYVHLLHGKKFYFEIDTELEKLDDDTWHREQLRMGNAFFHVVGEEYWTLSHYQQRYINDVKPVWDRYEELKVKNAQLMRNREEKDREIERLLEEKDRENERLKENLKNQERNHAEAMEMQKRYYEETIKSFTQSPSVTNNIHINF